MMGPTEAEVVWKPSWMDDMICSCPSVPGTVEGASLLFLQRPPVIFSRQLQCGLRRCTCMCQFISGYPQ